MSHLIKLCRKCGDVISQCRCRDRNKATEYGICNKCSQQGEEVPLKEYEDRVKSMTSPNMQEAIRVRKEMMDTVGTIGGNSLKVLAEALSLAEARGRLEENEACAKVADEIDGKYRIGDAIRSRQRGSNE